MQLATGTLRRLYSRNWNEMNMRIASFGSRWNETKYVIFGNIGVEFKSVADSKCSAATLDIGM